MLKPEPQTPEEFSEVKETAGRFRALAADLQIWGAELEKFGKLLHKASDKLEAVTGNDLYYSRAGQSERIEDLNSAINTIERIMERGFSKYQKVSRLTIKNIYGDEELDSIPNDNTVGLQQPISQG